MPRTRNLFEPLELPCGITLKNRIAKSAMSDSLGDGTGHPTAQQSQLYRRWAAGGTSLSIIGEVQGSARFPERPGNLVLTPASDIARFRDLARHGSENHTQLWVQLGHAGALAHASIGTPTGPSALDLPGLRCAGMTADQVRRIPADFARTAGLAQQAGFTGVQVHAAHGFLLSQFLSPLFNNRRDAYGGDITNRSRLLLETIAAIRAEVGPGYPIGVKLNATDQLEGGLREDDALAVVAALDRTSIDLIDISGGTYFPGARAASDKAGSGPYFIDFATRARTATSRPLMLTGGFKTRAQAEAAVESGAVDVVGLARAFALEPSLPALWQAGERPEPVFPRFANAPPGGITAWYTMRLTDIGTGAGAAVDRDLETAVAAYEARDAARAGVWRRHFRKQTATDSA